jgi:glucuronoxylan 4-O-methyltransferase
LNFFKDLSSYLAATFPIPIFVNFAKNINHIHLNPDEIIYIANIIKQKSPCRLLVFGLGNDSPLWEKLNQNGKTFFIEDIPHWFDQVMYEHPDYSGILVKYETVRTQWQELLNSPEKLYLELPAEITKVKFDCILVDGPHGWVDSDPGRMKSIFTASKLISKNGDIFIHDCDRIVEMTYCDKYLGFGELKVGRKRIRHYHF